MTEDRMVSFVECEILRLKRDSNLATQDYSWELAAALEQLLDEWRRGKKVHGSVPDMERGQ